MPSAAVTSPGERFGALTTAVVRRLPAGLDRVVAPHLVGFVLINSLTFGVDLAVLALTHGALRWPLAASVTCGYAAAFALGYGLNRLLNFRSQAALGPQVLRYLLVVAVNYAAIVLALTAWLSGLGVDYRVARVVTGGCEVLFVYSALRWFVFRDASRRPGRSPLA